jgi:hypothetical protein
VCVKDTEVSLSCVSPGPSETGLGLKCGSKSISESALHRDKKGHLEKKVGDVKQTDVACRALIRKFLKFLDSFYRVID